MRILILLVALGCITCQAPPNSGSLDDLIDSIFNTDISNQGIIEDAHNNGRTTQATTTSTTTTKRTPTPPKVPPTPTTTEKPPNDPIDPIDPIDTPEPDAKNPCTEGECTPYYLCPNGTIITDGAGVLDVRLGAEDDPEPERHPCPQFFDTCCLERSEEPIIKPIPRREGCGWRNINGVGFQIKERNGESQFAEFPWTIAIMVRQLTLDTTLNVYQCAGSLIHPSVVLTVAHCVADKPKKDLLARAGEWDTQTKDEPFPHQDRDVNDVLVHEHFKKANLFNDIALLFLTEPVKMIENVNTACLPPPDSVFDNKRCFATGWGKDKFGRAGAYQAILKKIDLPVVPSFKCQQRLRKTRLGKHFVLDKSFICAGGEAGKDTCTGDGGAPLSCEIPSRKQRYYEVGMVAWGIGCNEGHPGAYVNVPKFRLWIDKAFDARKLDKSHYEL